MISLKLKSAAMPRPMVFEVDTNLGSTSFDITFEFFSGFVDWGDGDVETGINNLTDLLSHTYASNGTYIVKVYGVAERITIGTPILTKVLDFGELDTYVYSFYGSSSLTQVPNYLPRSVRDLGQMFRDCTSFNQNINSWDTSNLDDGMYGIFWGASSFNQPLDNWDTSNMVGTIARAFSECPFNQNINNWDISSVIGMNAIFRDNTAFNQPLNNWNPTSVEAMFGVFYGATSFNQDINSWDVSSVANMNSMFRQASSMTYPIGSWQTPLSSQPNSFSTNANATFVSYRGTSNFPLLADGVTRINT